MVAKEQKMLTHPQSISAVASLTLLAMTNQLSQPAVDKYTNLLFEMPIEYSMKEGRER